jgi:hypothetical protein
MKKAGALDTMLNFCRRELPDALAERVHAHTEVAAALTGLSPAGVVGKLGPQVNAMIFTCIAEDLLAQPHGPDGITVADHFLKRHGWKLTSREREQIRMIRDAAASLYQVQDIDPGTGLLLKNLLVEEPTNTVYKPDISDELPLGSILTARLIRFDDVTIMSAGVLPLDADLQNEAIAYMREAADIGERGFEMADLAALPPHFTNFWLVKALAEQGVAMSRPDAAAEKD